MLIEENEFYKELYKKIKLKNVSKEEMILILNVFYDEYLKLIMYNSGISIKGIGKIYLYSRIMRGKAGRRKVSAYGKQKIICYIKLHTEIKKYCNDNGLKLQKFVEKLIKDGLLKNVQSNNSSS